MALNPFLSCIKGRIFSLNPKKSQLGSTFNKYKTHDISKSSQILQKNNNFILDIMERQQPASKRRKTEDGYQGEVTEADEWDDDDFDLQLTQAELEHMDTMASQAITQPTGISNPATQVEPVASGDHDQSHQKSGNSKTLTTGNHGSFVKPQNLSRSNSSSSSSSSRNTSSLSSRNTSNSLSSYSSSSSYPVTPKSSASHNSSSSLRSDSSLEMADRQMSRKPSPSGPTQSDYKAGEVSTGSTYDGRQDITTQLQEIRKELSNKDGEIKILRDTLQKKEAEITQAKKEKMQTIEQQHREQSDREKNLKVNLDRLTTQLQFKERDIAELHERCRSLEARQHQSEVSNMGGSPKKVLQHSPRPGKDSPRPGKDKSPVGNVNFPTKHSFMADDRSPKAKSCLSLVHRENKERSMRDIGTCTMGDGVTSLTTPVNSRSRQFLSTADQPRGMLTGAQLVCSLLETSASGVEQGIVGLLHQPGGNCDIQRLSFDRLTSSSMLSPLPNRLRASDPKTFPKQVISVGSPEHRKLALQGMQTLLRNQHCDNSLLVTAQEVTSVCRHSSDQDTDRRNISKHSIDQDTDGGAVLLLPLLADYLGHYLDLLSYAVEASPQSPSSSLRSSGSLDSSIESLSSSLSLFLRDSAQFVNNLETLCLAALSILHKLVSYCPSVRAILLESPESLTHQSVKDTATAELPEDGSGNNRTHHETDIPSSGSSSSTQGTDLHKSLDDIYLLRKIFSLANPGQVAHRYSVHMVERALDILTVLATHLEEDQVPQLLPVLHNSVLANCLECDDGSVVVRGLTLLTSLVKFNLFVSSLYVGPDGCLLCLLYTVCSRPIVSTQYCLQTSSQLFHCLNNIISVHKGGVNLLLKSDCRCSVQVIRTVVVVLHRLLVLYEEESMEDLLVLMRQGLFLLHSLYQRDEHFVDHHFLVEHQYVRLITGLTNIFKHLGPNQSLELSALGELWDFDEDYNELSQESEGDEDDIQQMEIS